MPTVNAYAATVRDRAARPHHHRAPRRRTARRPDRDQVRRHLPLRHPHRPRRLGPADLPAGPRPRDRRHRHRGRLGRDQARRRRPGRRRLHGQLLPRVRQLPGRRGAVLPRREHRHLRRRRPRRHHHPGRLLHPRRRRPRTSCSPFPRASSSTPPRRCCAPASPPTRRCATGAPAPARRSPIVGLGGLGHMAVKIAHAMGAEVTVLSQSLKKQEDGLRLGADHYYATSDRDTFTDACRHLRPDHQHGQRRRSTSDAYLQPAGPRRHPGQRRRPGGAARR